MTTGEDDAIHQEAFGDLVRKGVYGAEFSHPPHAQAFFRQVFTAELTRFPCDRALSVLDCGCGPGAWLALASDIARSEGIENTVCFGFDVTREMVEVARRRLAQVVPEENIHEGNMLHDTSYGFPGGADSFDIIFTYDVIQQLPGREQFKALLAMVSRLTPDGVVIIFDQDCRTSFGRKMAFKKFMTRYLGMDMVPRYYCNASYPPLAKFGARMAQQGRYLPDIKIADEGQKRALVIRAV